MSIGRQRNSESSVGNYCLPSYFLLRVSITQQNYGGRNFEQQFCWSVKIVAHTTVKITMIDLFSLATFRFKFSLMI